MVPDTEPHLEKLTREAIALMSRRLGWGDDFALTPLRGGSNNRVLRLSAGSHAAAVKIYFQHPQDQRNRLASEFAFGTFAWENGVKTVPRPLAQDPNAQVGFYSFVEGRCPSPDEIDSDLVSQAVAFFTALNRPKDTPGAVALPLASEAFFSVSQHVAGVGRRIDALGAIRVEKDVDREAQRFISDELKPVWESVRASLDNFISDAAPGDRCLSPSDFGFHNALGGAERRLTFFDFEYAGWDDPAKTVCDFFCQPKIPVPASFWETFARGIAACTAAPEKTRERADRLFPLYRVKWGCILLNEFLPVDEKRRHFAGVQTDRQQHKMDQLKKAKHMLAAVGQGGTAQ